MTGYAKVTRDFTDRKRAEEAVMLQLSSALLANLDVSKLLAAISASIHEVIPHDTAALALYDHATGDMAVQFHGTATTRTCSRAMRACRSRAPFPAASFAPASPFLMQRLSDIAFAPETVRNLTRLGMKSGCWVPLIHHGDVIGTHGSPEPA